MNKTQFDQLNTLLKQGILLLEKLSAIYDSEQTALGNKDLDTLSDIIHEKTKLLNEFHKFTTDRTALLAQFGITQESNDYSTPRPNPSQGNQGNPSEENTSVENTEAAETEALYASIKTLLTTLQEKNKRNEQIAHRSEQNVAQLLSLVRGQKKTDKLYNKAGSSSLYKAQSSLGKA